MLYDEALRGLDITIITIQRLTSRKGYPVFRSFLCALCSCISAFNE